MNPLSPGSSNVDTNKSQVELHSYPQAVLAGCCDIVVMVYCYRFPPADVHCTGKLAAVDNPVIRTQVSGNLVGTSAPVQDASAFRPLTSTKTQSCNSGGTRSATPRTPARRFVCAPVSHVLCLRLLHQWQPQQLVRLRAQPRVVDRVSARVAQRRVRVIAQPQSHLYVSHT